MAAHIWWITRVSSLRFSYSGMRFNRSWTSGRYDLNPDFVQAIWRFAHCLLHSYYWCVSWHDAYSRAIIPRLARIWSRRTDRMTLFRHLIADCQLCFLGYTWSFRLHFLKELERVLLCLYSPYIIFFITDNQRGILSCQIRQLHCRARGARIHKLCSHLSFHMDSLKLVIVGFVMFHQLYSLHTAVEIGSSLPIQKCI